jgi:hypothetical protein
MTDRRREDYSCMVTLASSPNDENSKDEVTKVTGCESRDESRHAGAAKAYHLLTSRLAKLRETASTKTASSPPSVRDPSSDKEFYVTSAQAKMDPPPYTPVEIPSSMASPVPEVLVSPTLDGAPIGALIPSSFAHDVTVRRAASDSHAPWHKTLTKAALSIESEFNAANPRVPFQGSLNPMPLIHWRAASTSTRPAEWTVGDDQMLAWP